MVSVLHAKFVVDGHLCLTIMSMYICFGFVVTSRLDFMSDSLRDMYKETRYKPQGKDWPSSHLKTSANVTLMHHNSQCTQQEISNMSLRLKEGSLGIDKLSLSSNARKIKDIFHSFQKCILIEGAPGIGKSVLSKEIAFRWATSEIFKRVKVLFLLCSHDHNLHSVSSVNEMLQYLNDQCEILSESEVEVAAKELKRSKGSNVVFIIDGYDGCLAGSNLKLFIDKLIRGQCLPKSKVVITSRPSATMLVHSLVDQRYEILGFANEERTVCISESLEGLPEKKTELDKYLTQYLIINDVTYSPIHLSILLYLLKHHSLPETLTESAELLILYTVYQELVKLEEYSLKGITKLVDLPKHVLTFVHQLSRLAFKGLEEDKLVFTYGEVKQMCPDIDRLRGAINGFGLLQVVEQYSSKGSGNIIFLHYAMQAYLAALHVSLLDDEQQSLLITKTFWSNRFSFMWVMYTGIVGIKSKGLSQLIKSLPTNYVFEVHHNNLRYLHLFQCYWEVNSTNIFPVSIYGDGAVKMYNYFDLRSHHIMSLMFFMIKYPNKWKSLEIVDCAIGNDGTKIIHQFFTNFRDKFASLQAVSLCSNKLSSFWGSFVSNNVEKGMTNKLLNLQMLDLSSNHLGDTGTNELVNEILQQFNMLGVSTTSLEKKPGAVDTSHSITKKVTLNKSINATDISSLQALYLCRNKISINGTVAISDCLKRNLPLLKLRLKGNKITDEGIQMIAEALQVNTNLRLLDISMNNIHDQGVVAVCDSLMLNNTLLILEMMQVTITSKGAEKIRDVICVNKNLKVLDITYSLMTHQDAVVISSGLKYNNSLEVLSLSWNSFQHGFDLCSRATQLCGWRYHDIGDAGACVISDFLCHNTTVEILDISHSKVSVDGALAIGESLKENKTLKELIMSSNNLSSEGVKKISESLQMNCTLQKLDISDNNIGDDGALAISECIEINSSLTHLNLACNKIDSTGTRKISKSLQVNCILVNLNISNNNLCYDGAVAISGCLKVHTALVELDISGNSITCEGAKVIFEAIQTNTVLQILRMSNNNLSSGALIISKFLKVNTMLTEIDLSDNNFSSEGALYIGDALQVNTALMLINISKNNITSVGAKSIAEALQVNRTVNDLDMSSNSINSEGALSIALALQVNTTLRKLNISDNEISDEGAVAICNCLRTQPTLITFNMLRNCITDKGAKAIGEAVQMNTLLQSLSVSFDNREGDCNNTFRVRGHVAMDFDLLRKSLSEGEKTILEAISVNSSLHSLDLTKCYFRDRLFFTTALLTALCDNDTLTKLVLKVDSDGCRVAYDKISGINNCRRSKGVDILHFSPGYGIHMYCCGLRG